MEANEDGVVLALPGWYPALRRRRPVAPKLNKENGKCEIGGLDHGFNQCLRLICEFQTFFKKVRVSPSGGINHFGKCGLMARVRALG